MKRNYLWEIETEVWNHLKIFHIFCLEEITVSESLYDLQWLSLIMVLKCNLRLQL